jgi:glutathione S-transferase
MASRINRHSETTDGPAGRAGFDGGRGTGKGQPDPVFIKRGEENPSRFAGVLDTWLRGRKWLLGDDLTIADFSIGALVPQSTHSAAHRSICPPTGRPYKS